MHPLSWTSWIIPKLSLLLSLVLCLELLVKQHFFANNLQFNAYNIRIGLEYIGLNILYFFWLRQSLATHSQNQATQFQVQEKSPSATVVLGRECSILSVAKPYFPGNLLGTTSQKNTHFFQLLASASIFLILAFVSFPNTKTDIYTYLHSGLMVLEGLNPYIIPAGDFSSSLSSFFSWKQTSTYGPISQLIFLIPALTVKFNLYLSIYIFKLFCLLCHCFNAFLIWRHFKISPYRNLVGFAYLVNPILLFEQVGQAHLDVFLGTFLLLLLKSIQLRQYLGAALFAWAGFLTKTIPVIWAPIIFIYLVSQKRWRAIGLILCSSIIIFILLSSSVFNPLQTWLSLGNLGVSFKVNRSIQALFVTIFSNFPNLFPAFLSGDKSYRVYLLSKWAGYLAYLAAYLFLLCKTYIGIYIDRQQQSNPEINLALNIGWSTLFLFLFATPWNPSWYVTILIPMLFFLLQNHEVIECNIFIQTSIIFCLSSITYYSLTLMNSPPLLIALDGLIATLPTALFLLIRLIKLRSINAIPI